MKLRGDNLNIELENNLIEGKENPPSNYETHNNFVLLEYDDINNCNLNYKFFKKFTEKMKQSMTNYFKISCFQTNNE